MTAVLRFASLASLALAALALSLAGCGGAAPTAGSAGTATLWVTRDRGASTLLVERVAAGQTLLRALRSRADVRTRYGGRFVQAIDGLEGSLSQRRDWFWFVNGYAGATSAAEYRLYEGDVAWWDYRDWSRDAESLQVVPGAFPEPFLHGFAGKRRAAAVRYAPGLRSAAERAAVEVGARDVAPLGTPVRPQDNLLAVLGVSGPVRVSARLRMPGSEPGSPVRFDVRSGLDALLSRNPAPRFGG